MPTGEYSLIHELFFGRVKINAGEGNAKLLGMKSVSQMTKVALVSLIWPNETKTYLRSSSSNSIALPPHRGLIGSVRIMGGMTTLILATTLWPLLLLSSFFFETWQSHYLSDKSSETITWTSLGTELVISSSPSTHSEPKAAMTFGWARFL